MNGHITADDVQAMTQMDGNIRLDRALALLGYNEAQPALYRGNLLSAIVMFAGLNHDEALGFACQARINMIRAENEAVREIK